MRFMRLRAPPRQIRTRLRVALRRVKKNARRLATESARRAALLWQRLYVARFRYLIWQRRHGPIAAAVMLLLLIGVSAYWVSSLHALLEPRFATEAEIASLRSLFVTIGGALIGAAAIVSSFVLFAMQVNIERVPPRREALPRAAQTNRHRSGQERRTTTEGHT